MYCRVNDGAARAELLAVFKSRHWRYSAPSETTYCRHDRAVSRLFGTDGSIDLEQAVARSVRWFYAGYEPAQAGELLRWAVIHGLVAFSEESGEPLWRLLRTGVTFIPREGADADVRTAVALPGGMAIASLASREEKLRRGIEEGFKKKAIEEVLAVCGSRKRDAVLGPALRSSDLPPVETIGEMADVLPDFLDDIPLHRVRELAVLLMQYELQEEVSDYDAAPPELSDFEL